MSNFFSDCPNKKPQSLFTKQKWDTTYLLSDMTIRLHGYLIKSRLPYQHQDPFGILYFSPFPRSTEVKPGRREAAGGQREETSFKRQRTTVCSLRDPRRQFQLLTPVSFSPEEGRTREKEPVNLQKLLRGKKNPWTSLWDSCGHCNRASAQNTQLMVPL